MKWRDHVTGDTKSMIENLIEISEKIKQLTMCKKKYNNIFIGLITFLSVSGFIVIYNQSDDGILFATARFLTIPFILLLALITAFVYYKKIVYHNKIEEKETRQENLRLEVIDHLNNPWYIHQHADLREEISQELEAMGINIRFKNI